MYEKLQVTENKCGMTYGFFTNHSYLGDISKMAE
jgi:hypothetical protein